MPYVTTIKNGLRVATDSMKETETVAINIWTKVGSRYEKKQENGISHFLEHMAFKGTTKRSAKDIAEEFDNIGGAINASTSREFTIYYAKVLKENFYTAMDVLADILQNSTFDPIELEKERGVILQEIAMTNDTPDDIIFDHYQEAIFGKQAISRPILGPASTIKKLTRENLQFYMQDKYHAASMVISVAGNIEHDKVLSLVEEKFAGISKKTDNTKEPAKYNGGQIMIDKDLEQVHWLLGFEGVPYTNKPDIYTIKILSAILGEGMSSRLFQEIREERGLAYSIHSFSTSYEDAGVFSIYAGTGSEQITELSDIVVEVLKKCVDSIEESEIIRAKTQIRAALLMANERSGARADNLGRNIACFDRIIPLQEILDNIESITKADINNMLERILSCKKPSLAAIGKIKNVPDIADIKRKIAA